MASKVASEYSLKLTGPGVTFDRPISEEIATRIISFVLSGGSANPSASAQAVAGPTVGQPQAPLNGGTTLKQFIAQKKPGNLYQRVACLAYYLAHFKDTPHFTTKDISAANTEAAVSRFSSASVFVNDASSKYGYLSPAGKKAKQITAFGEEVVQALPDQDAVKQLHLDNKTRGRKKSSRKKQTRKK